MTTTPVFKLKACEHKDLAKNTLLVNSYEVDYYLYVELPFHITEPVRLYSVKNITDRFADKSDLYNGDTDDTYKPYIIQEGNKWIRIATEILDLTPGQHTYRLAFMKADQSDLEIPLYISYILQTDSPDRPYIYMDTNNR